MRNSAMYYRLASGCCLRYTWIHRYTSDCRPILWCVCVYDRIIIHRCMYTSKNYLCTEGIQRDVYRVIIYYIICILYMVYNICASHYCLRLTIDRLINIFWFHASVIYCRCDVSIVTVLSSNGLPYLSSPYHIIYCVSNQWTMHLTSTRI